MNAQDYNENEYPTPPSVEQANDYPTPETEPSTDPNSEYKPKGFTAWIIGGLASAIVAVAVAYDRGKDKTNSEWKSLYQEEKTEHQEDNAKNEKKIESLTAQIANCEETTLDDLQKQFDKAQKLRLSVSQSERKIDEQINLTKQNAEVLEKATDRLAKEISKK